MLHCKRAPLGTVKLNLFIMVQSQRKKPIEPSGEDGKPRRIVTRQIKLFNDDVIVCLECGGEFTALHKHLQYQHNMTPEEYLAKYGLPSDFPLVAKNCLDKMRDQKHPNRTNFPKPHEIAPDLDDRQRLKKHIATRLPDDPAVPLDLSVVPEKGFIVLDDGRLVKQLHRYLKVQAKMSFEEYCEKWGLPDCYPRTLTSKFFKRPDEIAKLRAAERTRLLGDDPELHDVDPANTRAPYDQHAALDGSAAPTRTRSRWTRQQKHAKRRRG